MMGRIDTFKAKSVRMPVSENIWTKVKVEMTHEPDDPTDYRYDYILSITANGVSLTPFDGEGKE